MKETKKVGRIGWVIILVLILTPMMAHAWSEDLFSHFQPYIEIQEEYNSNIDLTPNRFKRDDFITTVTPGFKLSTAPKSPETGQFQQTIYGVDLDFNAGFNFFAKNHEDNYISLNGLLNAWYALSNNLNFRTRDYLIRSDDIIEPNYSANAIPGQYFITRTRKRTPWIRNVFEPSMQYEFGRKDAVAVDLVSINYRNNIYRIQGSTGNDSTENFISPKLDYWFDIRNGVSFQYGLTLGNFQNSPDLVGHAVTGRYTYRFNPNTSIFGEYTHLWRSFDIAFNDYMVYRPSLGIQHAFSPTLSGKGEFGYYWQRPEKGSTTGGFYYDVSLTQLVKKTTFTLSSQGGYQEDFFTSQNLGFTKDYRAIGTINHQLFQKMSVGLLGSFEWAKHSMSVIGAGTGGKKQTDKIWEVGGNTSYQILRWLTVFLDLSYRENNSNISNADYREYRAVLKARATY